MCHCHAWLVKVVWSLLGMCSLEFGELFILFCLCLALGEFALPSLLTCPCERSLLGAGQLLLGRCMCFFFWGSRFDRASNPRAFRLQARIITSCHHCRTTEALQLCCRKSYFCTICVVTVRYVYRKFFVQQCSRWKLLRVQQRSLIIFYRHTWFLFD